MSTKCAFIPKYTLARICTKALVVCIYGLVSGCVTNGFVLSLLIGEYTEDVTGKAAYAGGYKVGADYELQVDSFIYEGSDWRRKQLFLEPPEQYTPPGGHFTVPQTLEMYHEEPRKWPNIKGIVAKGTKFRVVKLIRHGAHSISWSVVYVIGEIQNGPCKGKQLDLLDASISPGDDVPLELQEPNPDILRLVESVDIPK
ncbi:MAG: hypothetical protein SGI88_19505 [Candidatus Hydrogenedentes bacterium]|nr:hypothetical protein [Candidatus Hydrogenedentota bacterium]